MSRRGNIWELDLGLSGSCQRNPESRLYHYRVLSPNTFLQNPKVAPRERVQRTPVSTRLQGWSTHVDVCLQQALVHHGQAYDGGGEGAHNEGDELGHHGQEGRGELRDVLGGGRVRLAQALAQRVGQLVQLPQLPLRQRGPAPRTDAPEGSGFRVRGSSVGSFRVLRARGRVLSVGSDQRSACLDAQNRHRCGGV